ncbi:hypothetical protein F5X98DRAFT_372457 [Xylaria grammica]|nr:hypothetical protein F5X98DRAFT_372457 [Xylaria grammica]
MSHSMDCCKFKTGEDTCGKPTVDWCLCEGHETLRMETHDFYKHAEAQWKNVDPAESDEHVFENRHKFLLLAVAGRLVHSKLFFEGERCDSHAQYAGGLYWQMKQEEVLLVERGKGFVVEGASYDDMLSVAKESVKEAFFEWHKSDKTNSIYHHIRGFPRAIASGTEVPEAVRQRMNPPENTDW